MAQTIEVNGIEELKNRLDSIMRESHDMRESIHTRVAVEMKRIVAGNVRHNLPNHDEHMTVQGWQTPHVGSGGGYAAVRAIKGKTGRNSPGAITNYLENGHKVKIARTVIAAKRSKSKRMRVVGFGFYADSKTQAKRLALEASDELTRWVKGKIEG
jgi:hypothetical protein